MAKTNNKRHHNLLAILCLLPYLVFSQAKSGVESYSLLGQGKEYVWMPILHYQSEKGLYTEFRYNYEDVKTFSLYAGKSFEGGTEFAYTIVPMIGISAGNFSGVSIAANAELDVKKFYISSQTQYSISVHPNSRNFFFSWSEMGLNISKILFAGAAIQYTLQTGEVYTEPGFLLGVNFKRFSVPFYVFNPFSKNQNIVVGLNFEYNLKKRK